MHSVRMPKRLIPVSAACPLSFNCFYTSRMHIMDIDIISIIKVAFVSSWGEANPGGGKDRVKLFIERSKKNVIVSRDSLKTVMDILDLKP